MDGRRNSSNEDEEVSDAELMKMFLGLLELSHDLHRITDAITSAEQRYNLSGDEAVNFASLKFAMKDKLGYKDQSSLKLVECSHKITKEFLINLGEKIGLSEAEVTAVLPAMAMKLTASETKFTLSAFKGGMFSKPQDLSDALRDANDKYTKRFGL